MTIENIPIMGRGREATLEGIVAIGLPEKTDTYTPVPNGFMYDTVLNNFEGENWELQRHGFKLTQNDQRLLCKMEFVREGSVALIAWANSYNKSLSLVFGSGLGLKVCTNGMFDGADVFWSRKHTGSCTEEVEAQVITALHTLPERLEAKKKVIFDFKNCSVSFNSGCGLLGEMIGNKVISSRVFGKALDEWRAPSFQEFSDQNGWSLYNALTYSLQQKDPKEFHQAHISIDKFLKQRLLEA